MSKQAPLPIRAEQLLLERSASFRFILSIDGSCLPNQVLVSMSKLALVAIATHANLYPVLAHLCFILGLVCLGRRSLRALLVRELLLIFLRCIERLRQHGFTGRTMIGVGVSLLGLRIRHSHVLIWIVVLVLDLSWRILISKLMLLLDFIGMREVKLLSRMLFLLRETLGSWPVCIGEVLKWLTLPVICWLKPSTAAHRLILNSN